jgi:hypothetical protein
VVTSQSLEAFTTSSILAELNLSKHSIKKLNRINKKKEKNT